LRTVRIVSSNLSGVNGFGKHSWKPAFSMRARSACVTKAVIAITGTLPPASEKGANFTHQLEAVHSRHINVGQRQIRKVIFYCVEAFRRIPRQQDVCAQVIQEQTQIPSSVVMIFHNENREITERVGRYVTGQRLGFIMTCERLIRIGRIQRSVDGPGKLPICPIFWVH
jgi:hypothetical protein